jgi:DNA-binding PadR family transcriptional regulator
MDVKHLCLGVLSSGPASGYDIKKHFESSFRHFFVAGYGSIYPALSKLLEQGHVEVECLPQERLPDKKIYRITEAGREAFQIALENSVPRHKIRSEFLAMMHFAHLLPPVQVREALEVHLSELEQLRDSLEQVAADSQLSCYSRSFSHHYSLVSTKALIDFVLAEKAKHFADISVDMVAEA